MQKYNLFFLTLLILLNFNGCSSTPKKNVTNNNVQSLAKLNSKVADSKINNIRVQALRDTALSLGARGGLAARAQEINTVLLQFEPLLYRIFSFQGMLLDENVLPPVLIAGSNTLQLSGSGTIHIADQHYQILHQARFVTTAPTWRDYLWLSYQPPEPPHHTLLPKSRPEKILWEKFILQGWNSGLQQAELIFRENIGRLKRDYTGMIRYRTLLAQNMVSAPFIARAEFGVTGGGEKLTINDRLLTITAFPTLQANSSLWHTKLVYNE